MTRGGFDTDLQTLHNDLIRMGSIVEKQIHQCIEALVKQDEVLANTVIDNDDLVDDLQKEIEDKCIRLIAKQQPLAIDLRNIFTASKIVTDLERMADHAVDIAKIAKRLKNEVYIKELIDIPAMAEIVKDIIHDSLDAYVESSVDKAYAACKLDDKIDAIYKQIFTELLMKMSEDSAHTNQVAQFLFVCKYLERVADHATNVCEWTIYLVTGDQIDLNE
ncbi:phosphate signaling complex protein PhoU [Clostridium sp. 19966]|uniref:phosphate signaling complex protein PhoU n=1 Tax=Clostridium sp. 19966 TaxID=2768166 RepID=UPI0028DE59B2|nr:phosphate signaling complex protein PhoU [Clostridium sp. 19966]MDT8718151.1 phosphate signaling complex protein PhoU [Clostridium sp. 19966]